MYLAGSVSSRAIGTPSNARWFLALLAVCVVSGVASHAIAQPAAPAPMQSLDEQVQEIKSEVLSIAAELNRLEEKLIYPSNTQVAVFVQVEPGEEARWDSVQIQLDGELVAHHIYSFKELEALEKGGVQRIYTGNVTTGDHRLEVAASGKSSGGVDFAASETFTFEKSVEPKLVGLTLSTSGTGSANVELGGW
jgi:histidinol-phosphate/aromatic aminotransferase/cobyric acid decarboxylase-like protein